MLTDTQLDYSASGVYAQWFSHWKIKADNCDIMK